jgi:nucleoside-diphosphate-sugar epimerase
MQKKVLVFGGNGFIAQVLVRRLLEQNFSVLVVDNLWRQSDGFLEIIKNPNFTFKYGSVTDYKCCLESIVGCDYIINLAALVGFPIASKYPELSYMVNVEGNKNLINARNEIDQNIPYIFTSTGSIYGVVEGLCTEETPSNAVSYYGKHKYEAENYIKQFNNVVIYRFATAFGISAAHRSDILINDLCYKAVYDRSFTMFEKNANRTFIHISDFVNSLIFAINNYKNFKYQIYNVGSKDPSLNCTKGYIAEYIKKVTGCCVNYEEFNTDLDKRDYEVSYDKIYDEGFMCKVGLEEGVEEILKAIPILCKDLRYTQV